MDPAVYEMVLNEFLQTDATTFAEFLRDWPADLYHIPTIVNAIWDRVDVDPNNAVLLDCLANISTVAVMFLAFPIRVWGNSYLCLLITFFRGFVVVLNRFCLTILIKIRKVLTNN